MEYISTKFKIGDRIIVVKPPHQEDGYKQIKVGELLIVRSLEESMLSWNIEGWIRTNKGVISGIRCEKLIDKRFTLEQLNNL